MAGASVSSVNMRDDIVHVLQQVFGFEAKARELKGPERGIFRCQQRECGFPGEMSVTLLCVAVADATEAAEHVTDGDDAGEYVIGERLRGRMMSGDNFSDVTRKTPGAGNDFATVAVGDAQHFLLGLVQRDPLAAGVFIRAAKFVGRNP